MKFYVSITAFNKYAQKDEKNIKCLPNLIYYSLVRNNLYFLVSKVRSRNSGKKKKNLLICISRMCMLDVRLGLKSFSAYDLYFKKKDLSAYRKEALQKKSLDSSKVQIHVTYI